MQSTFAEPLNYESEAFGRGFIPRLDEYCGILQSDLAPEGDDIGNGNANDYEDQQLIPEKKQEDIKPESELPDTTKKNVPPPGNGDKPKAIMPKKPGK